MVEEGLVLAPNILVGQMEVELGNLYITVAEKPLETRQAHPSSQGFCGESMPQYMWPHPLWIDSSPLCKLFEPLVDSLIRYIH